MFQFNIVFGILVAFMSNALLGGLGENAWRWMLGVEAIPAMVYTILCLGIPESPRWLIARRGDHGAGLAVLQQISPGSTQSELEAMAARIAAASNEAGPGEGFWSRRLRVPIALAFLAFFSQLSGINAILYFAPGYVFLFFCGMMGLQLVWVRAMVPETKGVPLEDIQKRLGTA